VVQPRRPRVSGCAADTELPARLEKAFRLLGKRIYQPSVRHLRALRAGLDTASIPLLGVLEEQGERRLSDIAEAIERDLSTVSRQARHLESLGLVVRRPDGDDGRAFRISLTPAGKDSLHRVRTRRAAMLGEVFHDWPEEEREELLRLLDRLLVSLKAMPSVAATGAEPVPAKR
jgi:DNA-binding MarR family transcriptional regulator